MIRSSSQLRPVERSRCSAVAVVIPALNEEAAIGQVLAAIPAWVGETIVVDNGSTDHTAKVARAGGARVIAEPRRGYGAACLAGLAAVGDVDIVVFLDADFSDHPDEMRRLVEPIVQDQADLIIGSRTTGRCEPGALTLAQRFGNAIACGLIRLLWGVRFTDLGPFRAVRRSSLEQLRMDDRGYGWTVQMQVRAARLRLRVAEVPVSYRRRIGRSKISGTVPGIVRAGSKILFTIWNESFKQRRQPMSESVIVFARDPQPGKAKTRLIPALGPEGAATFWLLEPLSDIDRPADVTEFSARSMRSRRAPLISVVIPAINEQQHIGRAIRSAMTCEDGEVEIIVVDGGSADATVRIARACGATVLRAPRGRAGQMNAGAAAAHGEFLLFLHADSRLPPGFATHVRRTLASPATIAGAFALEIETPSPLMRLYAATTNLRSRALGLPYGDQAIFLTKAAFDRVGGYPHLAIMEDLELVRRLLRLGRIRIANRLVVTSGRRWHQHGFLKTSLLNQFLILAHLAGVSPSTLYRWREVGIIRPAAVTPIADAGKGREMGTAENRVGQLHEIG